MFQNIGYFLLMYHTPATYNTYTFRWNPPDRHSPSYVCVLSAKLMRKISGRGVVFSGVCV